MPSVVDCNIYGSMYALAACVFLIHIARPLYCHHTTICASIFVYLTTCKVHSLCCSNNVKPNSNSNKLESNSNSVQRYRKISLATGNLAIKCINSNGESIFRPAFRFDFGRFDAVNDSLSHFSCHNVLVGVANSIAGDWDIEWSRWLWFDASVAAAAFVTIRISANRWCASVEYPVE